MTFTANGPDVHWCLVPIAVASLHALARKYERGADRSYAAVLADLRRLAGAAAGADGLRLHHDYVVRTADGGWLGVAVALRLAEGEAPITVLNARTWLDADSLARCAVAATAA